jgi:uncharacterized membrane protein (DUF4010 family)
VATWVQVMMIAAALSADAARTLAPIALAGLACAMLVAVVLLGVAGRRSNEPTKNGGASLRRGPLRLREALIVAALLTGVTLIAAMARKHFGTNGVFATAMLAGMADAHSPVASATALFASRQLSAHELVQCVLLGLSTNSAVRVVTAFVAGGPRYGARVSVGLSFGLAAAWGAAWALA